MSSKLRETFKFMIIRLKNSRIKPNFFRNFGNSDSTDFRKLFCKQIFAVDFANHLPRSHYLESTCTKIQSDSNIIMRISTVLLPFAASKVVEPDSDGWTRIKQKVDEDSFNFAILGDWVYFTNTNINLIL